MCVCVCVCVDEDGDGEAGGSTRGRFKRARQSEAPDDVINPDLPSDEDEGDALEREDDAQEGKNRFRGEETHKRTRSARAPVGAERAHTLSMHRRVVEIQR